MGDAAVAQMVEQIGRNDQVVGSSPTGGSGPTVVLRLVGAATLVGHKAQQGDAKLNSCIGGYGPVAGSASEAADLLLCNRPVRIPADWEQVVRSVLAMRALQGKGPDGEGRNWDAESKD